MERDEVAFCKSCRLKKPISDFYWRRGRKKPNCRCKPCDTIFKRDIYNRKKEQYKAQWKTYRDNNNEKLKEYFKIRYHKDLEKSRNEKRRYYHNNKESVKARIRDWQEINKEKVLEYKNKWTKNNIEALNAKSALRRSNMLRACPKWLSEKHWATIKEIYRTARVLTEKHNTKYHVDHIVPLKNKNVCGLHVPWNLRVLEASLNIKKGNKLLEDLVKIGDNWAEAK